MSLHIFSTILLSISSNTDSFAVAIAYGIKKIKITIQANLLIGIVSSLGTFVSMSIGETIGRYLPKSIAGALGSGVLISIGIFGLWQTIQQEKLRRQITKYGLQDTDLFDDLEPDRLSLNMPTNEKLYEKDRTQTRKLKRSRSVDLKQSIPLAFSLTINNLAGGIGAGISGLNPLFTTALTFILAITAIIVGSRLGVKFSSKMTEYWAGVLSSTAIIGIGFYEYFN
jgi:putative sporulation protein YtaF